MATTNDSHDRPIAEPGKPRAGADVGGTSHSAGADAGAEGDDDEEPWRHPPVAPRDEDPLKSLGRSVSETVTGAVDDKPAKPKD
jgi:hypothetical protein